MALGPAAPTHSFPAPFPGAARGGGDGGDKQAGARQRARAPRTRTWRADGEGRAGIHPGPGRLPRSRGHAATAAPTGGSWSRPRPWLARARRAAPQCCRSALTLAQARAPPAALAPRHPAPHGRPPPPPPLREPSLCRQPDKAPARGPLHHLPETGVFVTCRWAPSPTHPHMPTHPHVPAPTGGAGRKPALLLGPSRSQTHAEGHNRSASPSHVDGPQQARGPGGDWGGLGRRPRQAAVGGAEGARPPGWRRAPPRCLPLPPTSRLPARPPVSASGPIGLRAFPSRPAVARCLKLCVSGPRRAAAAPTPLCLCRAISLEGVGDTDTSSARLRKGPRCEFPASCLREPELGGSAVGSEPGRAPVPSQWATGLADRKSHHLPLVSPSP